MSDDSAAILLSVVMLAPDSANWSIAFCEGSATVMSEFFAKSPFSRPYTMAPPIAPAPITEIFIMCWRPTPGPSLRRGDVSVRLLIKCV